MGFVRLRFLPRLYRYLEYIITLHIVGIAHNSIIRFGITLHIYDYIYIMI